MSQKPHHYILLGPQGSGKGTQAEVLARRFRLAHFETGILFRTVARRNDALGRKLDRLVNEQGRLVPLPIVGQVVRQSLAKLPQGRGVVFDGFPRTLAQAKLLDRIFRQLDRRLTAVIYLPIRASTTVKRLSKRRQCERHGHLFILGSNLRPSAKRCPRCGSPIMQRPDDRPAAIRRRLAIFRKLTKPLVAYYRKRGMLMTVDGEPRISVVTRTVSKVLAARGI